MSFDIQNFPFYTPLLAWDTCKWVQYWGPSQDPLNSVKPPAVILSLLVRVYASGDGASCAPVLGEISAFSDSSGSLIYTLFYLAAVCPLVYICVYKYCCMSEYPLNWMICDWLKMFWGWTGKSHSSPTHLPISKLSRVSLMGKRKRKHFH